MLLPPLVLACLLGSGASGPGPSALLFHRANNTIETQTAGRRCCVRLLPREQGAVEVACSWMDTPSPSLVPSSSSSGGQSVRYEALFGLLNVSGAPYAAFARSSEAAEHIGPGVRLVTRMELQPLTAARPRLGGVSEGALRSLLRRHSFYFSAAAFDVTRTHQLNALAPTPSGAPGWLRADERFFWNLELLAPLLADPIGRRLVVPMSNLCAGQVRLALPGANSTYTLVSRRGRHRQGPRYLRRGVDEAGDVANFVETESVLRLGARLFSHQQVRGSIPIFWTQTERWRLRPVAAPQHTRVGAHLGALRLHLSALLAPLPPHSGDDARLTVVNLVDKHGGQGLLGELAPCRAVCVRADARLGRWFSAALQSADDRSDRSGRSEEEGLPVRVVRDARFLSGALLLADDVRWCGAPLRHVWLDYHSRCARDVDALRELFPLLFGQRVRGGDFGEAGANLTTQTRLVRTNCMDCLDRTNVVQTAVARWVLISQLQACGLEADTSADALALGCGAAETALRAVWADNGDALSRLYAGTE